MIAEQKADLTAEFLATSLLEDGLPADHILLRSLGAFNRRSHRDVENTEEKELGHFKGQVIESNRSGIYDYLPEQLFHLPSSNSVNTLKKKVDEIRLQREKEQKSRLFFLPLEQEFFLNRVTLAQLEQRASDLDPDSELLSELKKFWQVPESIPKQTFVRLLPVLPEISEHRGNIEMAARIIRTVLRLPVTITTVFGIKYSLPSTTILADGRLGMDTTLGGEMETYIPALTVNVTLPDLASLEECIHNPAFDITLNWLLGWFIPAEFDYSIMLHVRPDVSIFCLAEDGGISGRLGYSFLAAG